MKQIKNRADTGGIYNEVPIDNWTELSVELTALDIKKTADKEIWVKDNLTYTIVVTNMDNRPIDDPVTPGFPVTNITLVDEIDTSIAALVPDSVEVNGSTIIEGTDYTYVDGILTFLTLLPLDPGAFHTITFQVSLVQP